MEKRRAARHRTLKTGTIIFNGRFSVLACTIRNLSDTGAGLEMGTTLGVPVQFTLAFDGAERPCLVRWRTERRMGVSFE
jgi:hypothetical protein